MVEYPYGRNGEPHCHYQETATRDELAQSGAIGDNEVVFDGDTVYLYEAPSDDDPARGHFSEWQRQDNGQYTQTNGISGDDGMCYKRFNDAVTQA